MERPGQRITVTPTNFSYQVPNPSSFRVHQTYWDIDVLGVYVVGLFVKQQSLSSLVPFCARLFFLYPYQWIAFRDYISRHGHDGVEMGCMLAASFSGAVSFAQANTATGLCDGERCKLYSNRKGTTGLKRHNTNSVVTVIANIPSNWARHYWY